MENNLKQLSKILEKLHRKYENDLTIVFALELIWIKVENLLEDKPKVK